ncbi:MAG TPA: ParB/RepB/Spo0J family partition protein [Geminicoccaceae bacterium]|nr:ParB/RepB/Spo0J family partition protein [Geminicoccaceae bacterium]
MKPSREPPKKLGRGLSALFGEDPPPQLDFEDGDAAAEGSRTLPIEFLTPGKFQPRRRFAEEEIEALAGSIREKGMLQPILVRPIDDSGRKYEIVAGERRWRAAQRAQLHEVPVIVRLLDDRAALEVAIVENVQRESLAPLEEAEGYERLLNEFGYTQEALATAVGKSRSHVANMMRLLGLPKPVRALLDDGSLSAGHARALLGADDPVALARTVVARGLNVRQTERLAQGGAVRKPRPRAARPEKRRDPDIVAIERELGELLGLGVHIEFDGVGGEIRIDYTSLDQFDDFVARLRRGSR